MDFYRQQAKDVLAIYEKSTDEYTQELMIQRLEHINKALTSGPSSGGGLIPVGQGSYPKSKKKKKHQDRFFKHS